MYTYRYPHPAVTADCLVIAGKGNDKKILLIQRLNEPCKGCWAFPGGFMNIDETAERAAVRELEEETGLHIEEKQIIQVGAFSIVDRDPRERVITIAFCAFLDEPQLVMGDDDAAKAQWFALNDHPELAFDHAEILAKARQMLNF